MYNLLPSSHVLALKKQFKQSSRNHENVTKRRTQYLNPIFRSENIQEKLSVFEILGSFADLPQLDKWRFYSGQLYMDKFAALHRTLKKRKEFWKVCMLYRQFNWLQPNLRRRRKFWTDLAIASYCVPTFILVIVSHFKQFSRRIFSLAYRRPTPVLPTPAVYDDRFKWFSLQNTCYNWSCP